MNLPSYFHFLLFFFPYSISVFSPGIVFFYLKNPFKFCFSMHLLVLSQVLSAENVFLLFKEYFQWELRLEVICFQHFQVISPMSSGFRYFG